jgi:DNA replication protein DnaC
MREDLIRELEQEYAEQRIRNEQTEAERREEIRNHYPEIQRKVEARESLIFGTLRQILNGATQSADLTGRMKDLNRDIEEMLIAAGLPGDYLSPVFRCPVCKDTGYTGDTVRTPCECMKKAYQKKLRSAIGLDKSERETFEKFDSGFIPNEPVGASGITQRQISDHARKMCESWANQYPDISFRDILLSGSSGLGKTFLMNAMAERLIERGQNVLLVSAYTFLQMARKSYFESETGVQELMEVPVLMLDDLGSEPLMQNITREYLFTLLNERQTQQKHTVLATNLNHTDLMNRYGERVLSRLMDSMSVQTLELKGRDLRLFGRRQ